MSKTIPMSMKYELGEVGIWISETTFHIKPGSDLSEGLLEKALRALLKELEAD